MSLLQEQKDSAESMQTISDMGALEQMGIIAPTSTKGDIPYSIQPPLKVESDNSSEILQRLNEIESLMKSGFDEITRKLSNTVVSVAQKAGRRRTRRVRSKKYRR